VSDPRLDPVSVVQALIAAVVGTELAAYVGPYAVIAAGGAAGACFALSRRPPETNLRAARFVALMTALALLLTASGAELLLHWASLDIHWTLAPLAMLIGGIGHDWPAIGAWIITRAGRIFERRTGIDGGSGNG
jgi:hypothetical protein